VDVEAPLLSRYLLVVVQYDRRFEVERLRNHVVEYSKACRRPVSKSKLNYRLADDCKALTGFTHGGVTPVGSRTPLPVVLDARIAALVRRRAACAMASPHAAYSPCSGSGRATSTSSSACARATLCRPTLPLC